MNLDIHIRMAKSYVQLLSPLAEAVIHDIASNSICFIEGNLSKRKVGDPSFLDVDPKELEKQIDQIIYPKVNFDGRLIKSISIPIKDGKSIKALMCLNLDVSTFSQMQQLAEAFLGTQNNQPEILFKNDWQEKVHLSLYQFLNTNNLKIYTQGAFHEKKAADYIANVLALSRASIFNYLRELRNKNV